MSSTTSKPSKSEAINDFLFQSKLGLTVLYVTIVLFIGVIPAILLSMAP